MCHTPQESVDVVLISLSRPWARRRINHWSLWRMASATPDLRLPSQPQSIIASWLVPNYSAGWQKHVCVNNLPKVITCKQNRSWVEPVDFFVASHQAKQHVSEWVRGFV